MPHTNAWNETSPAGTDLISAGDNAIRQFKLDVRERMELDHIWNTSLSEDGKHARVRLRPAVDITPITSDATNTLSGVTSGGIASLTQTWNNAGGTFTALKANITDTASNAASLLLDLQVGGVSKFSVSKTGAVTAALGLAVAWPVGSIFISAVSTNPATLLGFGTWTAFATGRTIVGIDAGQTEFDVVEETGGAKTHTLSLTEAPAHNHGGATGTGSTGTGVTGTGTTGTGTTGNDAPDHTHGYNQSDGFGDGESGATGDIYNGTVPANTGGASARHTHSIPGLSVPALSVPALSVPALSISSAGGGGAHNNLQPYIVVYMWKRTA
jgi:microcystin-dependent protein